MYYSAQVSKKHLSSKEEALILIEIKEEQRLLSKQSNAVALDKELDYNKNIE
jgi:hypothetical protein